MAAERTTGGRWPWILGLLHVLSCGQARCGAPPNPERGLEGRAEWIFRTGGTPTTPALLAGGAMVVGTSHGRVLRLSADGDEIWNVRVAEGKRVAAVALSPDGATVYAGVGRGGRGSLVALDAAAGEKRWERPTPGRTPVPVVAPDGTIVVGGGAAGRPVGPAGTVWAVTPDGNERWHVSVGKELAVASPAVGEDGQVHVASRDGTVVTLGPDGRELWRAGDSRLAEPTSIVAMGEGRVAVLGPAAVHIFGPGGRQIAQIGGSHRMHLGVTGDGTLLSVGTSGTVSAIGPDGRVRWHRNLERARGSGERRRVTETPLDAVGAADGGAWVVLARGDQDLLRALVRLDARGRVKWRERLVGLPLTLGRPVQRADGTVIVPAGHWNRQVAKTSRGEVGHQRITCFGE